MRGVTQTLPAAEPVEEVIGRGLWTDALARLRHNRAAMISLIVLVCVIVLVLLGPSASPYAYDDTNFDAISLPPSAGDAHYFGTDTLGRDLFVRTLIGGRLSLLVGLVATLVSLVIGVSYGATAGYFGGRVDHLMMRIVDILYAMPFLFLVILLLVFFGRNLLLMFVAIGAINWLDMARIVRGQTLSLRRREFVEAAVVGGVPPFTIIRRHIVPNLLGIVAVYVTLTIPQVMLVESFLSFLGLGVQEPMTSWGALVNEGARGMETTPWMLIFPALFLAATLFCFNFVGDGLRDALDPADRK
ncbi:MAG: ABC transporter permease subunit [Gammaproteobacteria bacterium]|nr:ABC transporter permease subunit [Gammaproteobacteria bacterium]